MLSEGVLPAEFSNTFQEQLHEDVQASDNLLSDEKEVRKAQDEFLIMTATSLNSLYKGGRVMVGDVMTRYLNAIGNEIYKANPQLTKKCDFYLFKTGSVNAMALHEGKIFVNMGLLSRVMSEAELAYLLCHEMAHYYQNHLIDKYVFKEEVEKLRKKKANLTYDDYVKLGFKRSREHELEADKIGLQYFLATPYAKEASVELMNTLARADQPDNLRKMDKTFFDQGSFKVPEVFFKEELDKIEANLHDNDLFQTHPNTGKRIEQIKSLLPANTNGASFIVKDQVAFQQLKQQAMFECVELHLLDRSYTDAFYMAYSLLEQYPNNEFLRIAISKSLFGMAVYKNRNMYYYVANSYTEYGGQYQQINYFFKQLNAKQLTTLALKYTFTQSKMFPSNEYLKQVCQLLTDELLIKHDVMRADFITDDKQLFEDKYNMDKIVADNQDEPAKKVRFMCRDFYKTAFINELKDPEFGAYFSQAEKNKTAYLSYESMSKQDKDRSNRKLETQKEWNIKANNIIVLEPQYIRKVEDEKERKVEKSTQKEDELNAQLADYLHSIGTKTTFLSSDYAAKNDISYYNQMVLFKMYTQEWLSHAEKVDGLGNFNGSVIPPLLLSTLNEKYDLKTHKYLCYMQVYDIRPLRNYRFIFIDIETGEVAYFNKAYKGAFYISNLIDQFKEDFYKVTN